MLLVTFAYKKTTIILLKISKMQWLFVDSWMIRHK